jgi:hypothetical protein
MALLRQCLQAVRTKHHQWDVPNGTWPEDAGIALDVRAMAGVTRAARPAKAGPVAARAAFRPLTLPARPSPSALP